MPSSDLEAHAAQIDKLMEISVTLADYTQSADLVAQIPAYLARSLDLEPLTLAVVQQLDREDAPEIILLSSSTPITTSESADALQRLVRDIHAHPRTVGALKLRSPFVEDPASEPEFIESAAGHLEGFPRALVLVRAIDNHHRLCLILHRRAHQGMLPRAQLQTLAPVASLLAKLLRCLIAWQDRPEILGSAFERLTDREWIVLRNLNSDQGEKQLADRLSLSPHTLHSHIKSIYRKVGVQGRLPLLIRLNAALRELRTSTISAGEASAERRDLAVSAG
jgi:DNA-binding NarL/FixJ family response regulator